MPSELERDDQVVARVVAWHNRHPLATRIAADQVHSVGVVSLPFAVQGAERLARPSPPPAAPPADLAAEAEIELAIESPDLDPKTPAAAATPAPVADPPAPADVPADLPPPGPLLSTLPPRSKSWRPLTGWRRSDDDGGFRALFSEDFIGPLHPRRVARWVAAHGVGRPPLADDAPRRVVALDPQCRRPDDAAPEVELHVITAAIGIGEQRRRVLLAPGARGAILGPRHWSRPRSATAGALLAALLLPAAALPWLQRDGAAPPPAAASPASAVLAALPVSERTHVEAADEPVVAAAADPPSTPPPDAMPRTGRFQLDPLVPRLADGERQQLSRHGRELRAATAPPAEAKAWALVTAPLDQRRAERAAAQLQAVALFQPGPMRVERMPAGARWRAVFWPFTSAQDAEKVRLALADKGLQTELLEF